MINKAYSNAQHTVYILAMLYKKKKCFTIQNEEERKEKTKKTKKKKFSLGRSNSLT